MQLYCLPTGHKHQFRQRRRSSVIWLLPLIPSLMIFFLFWSIRTLPASGIVSSNTLLIDSLGDNDLWSTAALNGRFAEYMASKNILGEERDMTGRRYGSEERARIELVWDGPDNDVMITDYRGLGGLNLADGNLRDMFTLEVLSSNQPANLTFEVFSDESNASRAKLSVPGGINMPTHFTIPFDEFTPHIGRGTDWADVGAIVLTVETSDPTGIRLGNFTANSTLSINQSMTLRVDLNGNGAMDTKDVAAYTFTIANNSDRAVHNLTFNRAIFSRRATLRATTIVSGRGSVTSGNRPGDSLARVTIGTLSPGEAITIAYEVVAGPQVIVEADLVVEEGSMPPGSEGAAVTNLTAPFTNDNGQVGFTGALGNNHFVWFDDGIIWRNSDWISNTLSGSHSTMGIGNNGEFVYRPQVDGAEAVWTHNGPLLIEGAAAPGIGDHLIAGNAHPTMLSNGTVHWVSNLTNTVSSLNAGRVLYRSIDTSTPVITPLIKSGDVIDNFVIQSSSTSIDFDYDFSDDGSRHAHVLFMETGNILHDGFVYIDGALVAREASSNGSTDNWDTFDLVRINNSGNYLITGDTDGFASFDEFIAYNDVISIRESGTVDGVVLTTPATVEAADINNLNQAVYSWRIGSGEDVLFFACDAADLGGSHVVLATGDMVDFDSDGTGDAVVTSLNARATVGPGLSLAEDGFLYVEASLNYGSAPLQAIIRLQLPTCGAPMAADDSYTSNRNGVLTVSAPGVLGNDSDTEGDLLTAILDTPPVNGTLNLRLDGSFVYTPTAGFIGTDMFNYHANDGVADSNSATVTITVTNGNLYLPAVFHEAAASGKP